MLKRWLTILILLVLVVGLGIWVYWLERPSKATASPLLANFDPNSVQRIVIERQGERMVFARQEAGWRMTEPFDVPADAYHIQQLLALPNQTSQTHYAASGLDLKRFELAPPQAVVRLGETEFRFGGQNPLNFQRYIQVGELVHLSDDTLFYQLTAPATAWVEHKLLPEGRLKALEVPGWRIAAKDTGGFVSEPELPAAELEQWLDTWRTARAIQVTPHPEEPPPGSFRIKASIDGQTLEFIILQQEPELVLLRPEQKLAYHFYGAIGQRLLHPKPPSSDAGASRSRNDTPGS